MTARRVFEGQWIHALGMAALFGAVGLIVRDPTIRAGELLGLGSGAWLWLVAASAAAHQLYVWLCWRLELHAGLLSRALGRAAFPAFAAGFSVLGTARVASIWALAVSNQGTLGLDPTLSRVLATLTLIPALYLFYSVRRYFGFRRALGIDHFDPGYRSLPLVREGAFRWSPNAMYVFGFLLLWAIALAYVSLAALAAALFTHLYIWVHFHATERPDMRRIYGRP